MQPNEKDFLSWHNKKVKIDLNSEMLYFREREIWWCSVGLNIGSEQNGKGKNFCRPVLIYKKFSPHTFWGIPLSSKSKNGDYYFSFTAKTNFNIALLHQIRLFDSRRLMQKFGTMSDADFVECKKRLLALY